MRVVCITLESTKSSLNWIRSLTLNGADVDGAQLRIKIRDKR
jgi:hypothetical protein